MAFPRLFSRRAPRLVALGGGTGLSILLRGLKERTDRITAVVTVADDGGSSGRIRKGFDLPPPGDIRNCLVALADAGPLMEALLQYRFQETDLKGHSVGNLLLTALARITGDFRAAVREVNRILNVRGQVLPATDQKVALVATHDDGTKSTGELAIGRAGRRITHLELKPTPEPLDPEIRTAIAEADLVVLGPGSLYTSVLPNLLVPGMIEALERTEAPVVYVCNVMTQPGETDGFSAYDHLTAIAHHTARDDLVDVMLLNSASLDPAVARQYEAQGQAPVVLGLPPAEHPGLARVQVETAQMVSVADRIRHQADRLGEFIVRLARRTKRAVRTPTEAETEAPALTEAAAGMDTARHVGSPPPPSAITGATATPAPTPSR